jgi:hypothetical protein
MNKTRFFILILSANILFYFFKIDRDLYAFQEIVPHPHQAYNEQPLIEKTSYLFVPISGFSKFLDKENLKSSQISIWNPNLLSYNSKLLYFLKTNKACNYNILQIVSVLFKKNIYHKSSIDGELFHHIFI